MQRFPVLRVLHVLVVLAVGALVGALVGTVLDAPHWFQFLVILVLVIPVVVFLPPLLCRLGVHGGRRTWAPANGTRPMYVYERPWEIVCSRCLRPW